ncbi:MAG: IS200/IS605 family transposase [Bacteroidales bacterium]
MGYLKIWIHIVWITKKRKKILTEEVRKELFKHIRENAKEKGIYVDFINGYLDHVHCLISLHSGQTIDNIVMMLKGESSNWLNKNKFFERRFEWQREYFAVSVNESSVNIVRNYIKNQENHHRRKSFDDEYLEFMRRYKFEDEGLG